MKRLYMKKFYIFILMFIIVSILPLNARDVNLDKIYLKKNSNLLYKLIDAKLEMFNAIGASLVDHNIIFSGWTSGNRIIYIQEYVDQNINYVYEYFPTSRIKNKIALVKGAIIFGRISNSGHYFFIKRMIKKENVIPENEIVIIDLRNKKEYKLNSKHYFLDFTTSYDGEAIIYESDNGIVEYFPSQKKKRLILQKKKYNSMRIQENPVLAYQSSNKKNLLLLSGGGGQYNGRLYAGNNKFKNINGITSSSEFFWLDNNKFVYRKGYTGFYQVVIYNIKQNKTEIISEKSLNTNIIYSARNKTISFLQDGGVAFYKYKTNKIDKFPLEGEDLIFSPKGNIFCIIYNKKLFLAKQQVLYKKNIEVRRISKRVLKQYNSLLKNSSEWSNTYSANYIQRKIKLYKDYLR